MTMESNVHVLFPYYTGTALRAMWFQATVGAVILIAVAAILLRSLLTGRKTPFQRLGNPVLCWMILGVLIAAPVVTYVSHFLLLDRGHAEGFIGLHFLVNLLYMAALIGLWVTPARTIFYNPGINPLRRHKPYRKRRILDLKRLSRQRYARPRGLVQWSFAIVVLFSVDLLGGSSLSLYFDYMSHMRADFTFLGDMARLQEQDGEGPISVEHWREELCEAKSERELTEDTVAFGPDNAWQQRSATWVDNLQYIVDEEATDGTIGALKRTPMRGRLFSYRAVEVWREDWENYGRPLDFCREVLMYRAFRLALLDLDCDEQEP